MIHHLSRALVGGVLALAVLAAPLVALSQAPSDRETARDSAREQMASLAWQRGPADAQIGSEGTLKLSQGQAFLDGPNTRRFLELNRNPGRDNHYTLVGGQGTWFAVFYFESSGYVKDDEKLDADEILKSIQATDEPSNKERKRLGMPPLYTVGWHVPPHYDLATKRLEWGMRLRTDDNDAIVNYTIRLLGRRGVMHATLVSDPEHLDRDIADFKSALGGYAFVPGEKYAEFRAGDKVAEYGLAALVLGGGAAVAVKSGFGKAMIKFVVVGVAAAGSAVAAFFRRFRRSDRG
ncbi:MAG TPA: DUF2167 domain-containing protein [Methylomirabilota bacterium]|jgi:uncharacterized membrane-anchored protein